MPYTLKISIQHPFLSKMAPKPNPEGKTGGGGLEDDDVWGDVDDVSKKVYNFINQIINGNSD